MAIKCIAEVTVVDETDIDSLVTWFKWSSSATLPSAPTTTQTSQSVSGWQVTEPGISTDADAAGYVYAVVQTRWKDGSCTWGSVSMSASFEAAKRAWNKAASAHDIATQASTDISRTNERIELLAEEVTLKSSGSGTSVVTEGAATAALDALAVYGKSVQDGTPTPSAPVPIQSVESPSIRVTDSGGTVRSTTPIPLQGHQMRSLPDGTRDELAVDADGRVSMTQRVTQTTQAITDGVSGTVGTDVMSSTGAIADGATVLYHGAESTIDLGTIDMPEVQDGDTVEVIASVTPSIDCVWYTSQELADEAARRAASIALTADGVRTEVSDQVRDLNTQISQTARDVTIMFNQLIYGDNDAPPDEQDQINQTIMQAFDALGLTQDGLEELRTFVRVTTDEQNTPYLLMGSESSPVMMALTNSMLEFRHGDERLAYIEVIFENDEFKESRFHIQKAMIDEVLQFGSETDTAVGGYWQWFERANGNLALKWVDISSGDGA